MLLLGIFILFTSNFASASYEEGIQKPNNVVVKGSVFCDTQLSETAYILPGALVAVDCSINSNRKWKSGHSMVYVEGETDVNGEFTVELPTIQNLHPRKSCSVKLLSSPHELCDIPSITTSSQLVLTSSNPNGMHIYVSTPLSYRKSKQYANLSSLLRRRALQAPPLLGIPPLPKFTFPPLPSVPSLPKFSVPPLPSIPPLPKVSVPPLPTIPPLNIPNVVAPPLPNPPTLPKLSVPPLPSGPALPKLNVPPLPKLSVPPLPSTPPLHKLSVPPLPSVPTLPKLSVPPLPNAPPLPKFSIPPLPNAPSLPNLSIPPLNMPSIPPFPKLSFPPLPTIPSTFPPFPLFTPPPPSTKDETP
ncbi:hypothetical protein SUGI_0670450 [Cryptomeria japonica]|uniref:uncharacterized protein LOC131051891 n=1 Tax=Cryptomeria japonica TaxID=3369 RepID=UPI0024148CA0|nr:uncharacterized protein LOC131051891 [Cryptomeria japonica]GLJ33327.1 hypothetical protein SUGI_0670450 [Cryptomeria japonica]